MSDVHPYQDLLLKTADYSDALEAENARLKAAEQEIHDKQVTEEAQKIAERYTDATGEELDLSLAKKIAGHDDREIKQVLHKLAHPEYADTLGHSQRDRTKVASDGDAAWDRMGNWLLSD